MAEVRQDDTLTPQERGAYARRVRQNEGKRERLKHALNIEQFAHQAIEQMRETLSFSDPESARDNALALASAVKSWDTAGERVRILKGEALPGNKRPLPEAPKVKAKKLNRPPPSLAPAKVVPEAAA